ncbi:MAG TPA: hypothetical protein PKL14_00250 [Holophaga sp.]|jgi:predicted  nucleic acid-binding Zn-ribbon protein|nr:hypothetical protein [Holophaga sp.]
MNTLPMLLELQSVHDNLATIQKDLSDYPPEMSQLDKELKQLVKRIETAEKALAEAQSSQATLASELKTAEKHEGIARAAVKSSTQKIQFTAAIRDLDERERQKTAVLRPLREAETRQKTLEADLLKMKARQEELKSQFASLEEIFLSEHENQVAARTLMTQRQSEIEQQMEATDLTRFNRILHARNGKAVAPVQDGTCTGCRTKLRTPLLARLREENMVACEACQRILFNPEHQ